MMLMGMTYGFRGSPREDKIVVCVFAAAQTTVSGLMVVDVSDGTSGCVDFVCICKFTYFFIFVASVLVFVGCLGVLFVDREQGRA